MSSARKRGRSPAAQDASRRNGKRSRGPTSTEGKQRSARNAFKHGLRARSVFAREDRPRWLARIELEVRGLIDEEDFAAREDIDRMMLALLKLEHVDRLLEQAGAELFAPLLRQGSTGTRDASAYSAAFFDPDLFGRDLEALVHLHAYRRRFRGQRDRCIARLFPKGFPVSV